MGCSILTIATNYQIIFWVLYCVYVIGFEKEKKIMHTGISSHSLKK